MTPPARTRTTQDQEPTVDSADNNVEPDDSLDDEPVLDLTELAPKRPTVLFITKAERDRARKARQEPKPTRYELQVPQDFDVEEEHTFRAAARDFDELMNKAELNRSEKARLRQRLEELFDSALIAPAEVKAEFSDRNKQAVVKLFTLALLRDDAEMIEQALPMMPNLANSLRQTMER